MVSFLRTKSAVLLSIVIFPIFFLLSGCFSFGLMLSTKNDNGYHRSHWKGDSITALSLAKDSNGTSGWVFIGGHFDYLLIRGGDNAVNILRDPLIHHDKLSVENPVEFIIDNEKKQFNGKIKINYNWVAQTDKEAALTYGFICKKDINTCSLKIDNLLGTVHQKNKEQKNEYLLPFNHPFNVEFYQYKENLIGASTPRILLPVTLALDIVTSPLQLLMIPILSK
ncbi:hypothetical protein ACK4PD_05395 [Proteus mirabilis]|uniref:YidX family protein n=1 Tax=Proteus mirabilis TaxID=584 RepID=UPI00391ABCBC